MKLALCLIAFALGAGCYAQLLEDESISANRANSPQSILSRPTADQLPQSKISRILQLLLSLLTQGRFRPTHRQTALEKYKVVPDLIAKAPREVIRLQFGPLLLKPGQIVTPTQVKETPKASWKADKKSLYTLLFTDIDTPPEHDFKAFTHWLVVNVSGSNVTSGKTIYQHFGAGAPEGSGLHRYVFLLYKQQGTISDTDIAAVKDEEISDRGHFSIDDFAKEHKLVGPIAANFYRAQYDDSVPLLMAEVQKAYEKH